MLKLLVWMFKLPFMLIVFTLVVAFGLIGIILSLLGVALTPLLGVGLLILPFGLTFLFIAWWIAQLFDHEPKALVFG